MHYRRANKTASASSVIYQGPNGEMNAALGVINQKGDKAFSENRFFTSTPDGLVLERNICNVLFLKGERYFHSVQGVPIGKVEFISDGFGIINQFVAYSNTLFPRPSTQAGGGLSLASNHGYLTGQSSLYSVTRPQSFGEASWDEKISTPLGDPKEKNPKLLRAMFGEENHAGNGAGNYTVTEGDTYPVIAKKVYGDASLEDAISLANGGQALIVGQNIQIPQLMPSHNGPMMRCLTGFL